MKNYSKDLKKEESVIMEKGLPIFNPAIPGIISIIFAIATGVVAAKWLDIILNL